MKALALEELYYKILECSYDIRKAHEFILQWMKEENDDIRILLGHYETGELTGFIGGSLAEETDINHSFEVNYLFVKPSEQRKGIGKKLLLSLSQQFLYAGLANVLVYTHKKMPSNQYYKQLGFDVLRSENQNGLTVEVLNAKLETMINTLQSEVQSENI